jgi:hypothetical protein
MEDNTDCMVSVEQGQRDPIFGWAGGRYELFISKKGGPRFTFIPRAPKTVKRFYNVRNGEYYLLLVMNPIYNYILTSDHIF